MAEDDEDEPRPVYAPSLQALCDRGVIDWADQEQRNGEGNRKEVRWVACWPSGGMIRGEWHWSDWHKNEVAFAAMIVDTKRARTYTMGAKIMERAR